MKEIEVKAKLRNKEEVMRQLEDLGCLFSEPIIQKDTIFILNGTSLPTAVGGNVLRIREQNGKYIFTLKQTLKTQLAKLEYELDILDPQTASDFCNALGYKKIVSVKKARLKTQYKNNEICIDDIEGLGLFIEMEELTEEEVDSKEIQVKLFNFLKTLGVKEEDREYYGYDVLLYQKQKAKT